MALAVCAFLPASASGATFCVQGPCPSGPQTHPTLSAAAAVAENNGEPDRIEIGAGDVAGPNTQFGTQVTIVGAGRGVTRLLGQNGVNTPALRVTNSNSTLSDLAIRIGGGATGGGLGLTGASATRIDVLPQLAPTPTTSGRGVDLSAGATLTNATVLLDSVDTAISAGAPNGQVTTLEDVRASGPTALSAAPSGTGRVVGQRLTLDAVGGSYGVFSAGAGGTLQLSSSLVRSPSVGVQVRAQAGPHATVLRGVTVVGTGQAGSSGIESLGDGGNTATATVRDTTVTGFTSSLRRTGTGGGIANLDVAYSNFDPSLVSQPSGSGTLTSGAGNVNVSPGFTDPAAGDYRLLATSSLIDAGDPSATTTGDSATDLGGTARPLDGRGTGTARADIGAYEYEYVRPTPVLPVTPPVIPPAKDTTRPVLSSLSLRRSVFAVGRASTALGAARKRVAAKRGTTIRYSLSEAATVKLAVERRLTGARIRQKGKRVCAKRTRSRRRAARCTRYQGVRTLTRKGRAGRTSVAFTGRLRGRALAPGRYRLRITATDAAGNRSATKTLPFRIVR